MEKDSDEFFIESMKSLLSTELDINENVEFDSVHLYDKTSLYPDYFINFEDFTFKVNGWLDINKIFYLESYSLFDILSDDIYPEHLSSLEKTIFPKKGSDKIFDDIINKPIINLEKIVNEIIGGGIVKTKSGLEFQTKDFNCSIKNTASGIKQIAVIQLLLKNRALEPNSFLIIDEPEVNLHPEWQLKLAQILVLLAKVGDINLYINTHSPLFIEAINVYSKYYELDDVNYYLTEFFEDNKYKFNKLSSDDLNLIYDDLGQPYHEIDIIETKYQYRINSDK